MKLIKYIIGALLLIALILYIKTKYIKIIPNYSKSSGTEWVLNSNYKKYQDGYCLDENRIFSDEEIFRRGINQFLDKSTVYRMEAYWEEENADYTSSTEKPGNYFFKNVHSLELKKIFIMKENSSEYRIKYYKFFQKNKISLEEVKRYLDIDLKTMTGGFPYPLSLEKFTFFLDKSFLLKKDSKGFSFSRNSLNIYVASVHSKYYEDALKEYQENLIKHKKQSLEYDMKIDNCGNVDY